MKHKDRLERPSRLLRHVVLFAFRDSASPEDIREIEEAFCALPDRIDEVHGFEWGTDVSAESLSQGYSHCFLVTFLSERGRDRYLPHPAHQEFVAALEPHLEKVLVIDYWATQTRSSEVI